MSTEIVTSLAPIELIQDPDARIVGGDGIVRIVCRRPIRVSGHAGVAVTVIPESLIPNLWRVFGTTEDRVFFTSKPYDILSLDVGSLEVSQLSGRNKDWQDVAVSSAGSIYFLDDEDPPRYQFLDPHGTRIDEEAFDRPGEYEPFWMMRSEPSCVAAHGSSIYIGGRHRMGRIDRYSESGAYQGSLVPNDPNFSESFRVDHLGDLWLFWGHHRISVIHPSGELIRRFEWERSDVDRGILPRLGGIRNGVGIDRDRNLWAYTFAIEKYDIACYPTGKHLPPVVDR